MKILLNTSPIRKKTRNTDLLYLDKFLVVQDIFPDLSFETNEHLFTRITDLTNFVARRLLDKVNISVQLSPELYYLSNLNYLPASIIQNKNYDIILAHGSFPVSNYYKLPPIIWETGMLGLEYLESCYSDSQKAKQAWLIEKQVKEKIGQKATIIGLSHPQAAERFCQSIPSLAHKVRVLPPFLPNAELSDWDKIKNKFLDTDQIQITLIGNQAKRKGLPEVYEALSQLPNHFKNKIKVTVVSTFLDGYIPPPPKLGITYLKDLNSYQINELLEKTHIYCMPSRSEAYGFTYIEAMAKGCIVIAPNREPQDYLLDFGQAGILTNAQDIKKLATDLESVISEPSNFLDLVKNAWNRVKNVLGAASSASKYMDVFREAL
jgi:glycosyltransferase involved in cell wall biosynthesis